MEHKGRFKAFRARKTRRVDIMNRTMPCSNENLEEIANQIALSLSYAQNVNGRQQIVTPLVYPGGGFVVLSLEKSEKGYLISDYGGAYRESELMCGGHKFKRLAHRNADLYDVKFDSEMLFEIDVAIQNLVIASIAIANASKSTVEDVAEALSKDKSDEQRLALHRKLYSLFPKESVQETYKFSGRTENWEFDAAILNRIPVLFQVVAPSANSVNATFTKFFDVKDNGENKTIRVSVPTNIRITPRVDMLNRISNVIELNSPDQAYLKLAA